MWENLKDYDREKIVEFLINNGYSYEDANEYIDFNMAGAWMGEEIPLIMTRIE